MIRYFRKGLRPSIWALLEYRGRDLDVWEKVVEKAGNAEAKANLQPPFYVRKIDSGYLKDHCPSAKKDKKNIYLESCNEVYKDKDKAKSQTSSSPNQPQTQASKKNKRGCRGDHRDRLTTGVHAVEIAKKDKDKALKDQSHIKCYTYHQKGSYANKCPEKWKN